MGAGIVGSSLAIGLARLGLEVTVVERSTLGPGPESFGIDVRSVAITPASKEFLASLDLWDETLAQPYRAMSIWETHGVSNLDFNAKEMEQNCLGWIVEAKKIQLDIWKKLDSESVAKITAGPTGLSILGDGIEQVLP